MPKGGVGGVTWPQEGTTIRSVELVAPALSSELQTDCIGSESVAEGNRMDRVRNRCKHS